MFDRRGFLVAGAALASFPGRASGALPVPGARLGFDILYKGSKLGTHVLTFDRAGSDLTVQVAADLSLRVLGLRVYRSSHRAIERWRDGKLVALQTSSDDNGTRQRVSVERGADGLVVQATGLPRYVAPANALAATHWNRGELDGPLIDPQSGRLLHPTVVPGAVEAIPTASRATLRARRFTLTGDTRLDLFYDDRLGWAGLTFTKVGSQVRYVRQGI